MSPQNGEVILIYSITRERKKIQKKVKTTQNCPRTHQTTRNLIDKKEGHAAPLPSFYSFQSVRTTKVPNSSAAFVTRERFAVISSVEAACSWLIAPVVSIVFEIASTALFISASVA